MTTSQEILQSINIGAVLSWISGILIPLLVGLVTKTDTNAKVKVVLNVALSAASAVVAQLLTAVNSGLDFNWLGTIATALITFVISGTTYNHVWKPTGVARRAQLTLVRDPEPMKAGRLDGDLADEDAPQHAA